MNLIEQAKAYATMAHEGQTRKDRKTPYITHPEAVAGMLTGDDITIAAAWLHDVLEDTCSTEEALRAQFPKEVVDIVKLLTRVKKETYRDYIMRIVQSENKKAMRVKLADLAHNMSTLEEGSMKDKYRFAQDILHRAVIE